VPYSLFQFVTSRRRQCRHVSSDSGGDEMENNVLRLFTFLVGQPQPLAQKSVF
jgi:hypothetical protein